MGEYTIERLQSLDDLGEMLEIGEEWGVNFEGLATEESFKERLILHKRKQSNEQYFKMDEADLPKMYEEHEKKTRAIIELFQKVRTSLGPSFTPISSILQAGNTTNDLSEDFNKHISDLQQRECCVVVSGETSSGKSSLLNLILGVDILPTHNLNCTFLICKLKFSAIYKSKIIREDGSSVCNEYPSIEETRKALNDIVFERNQRNRQNSSSIKEVEIHLPADILKSGITIVDTPGFGENGELDSLVERFFSSNSITGFIYLIKSDTAGGVHEDRLLRFFKEIRKQRRNSSISNLQETADPKSAMFICNRWDIIREDQRERVQENAISKLSDAWPGFTKSQVTFFSTDEAAKHAAVDRDYITGEFAKLLTHFVDVSQLALDTRIKQHYRWLTRILQQATNHVISMLSQISKSDEELYKKFTDTKKRLDNLRLHSQTTVTDINKIIVDETKILLTNIKTYVHPNNTQLKEIIGRWNLNFHDNLRRASIDVNINRDQSFNSYDSMALRNLVDEVDKWIRENQFAEQMTTKVEDLVNSRLEGLKSKMNAINYEITDNSSLTSSSSCSIFAEDDIVGILYTLNKDKRSGWKSRLEHVAGRNSNKSVFLQPKVLVARAILSAIQLPQTRRMSTMHSDPQMYVKEKAIKFMEVLYNDDTLIEKICTRYTENLLQYVETIQTNIPRFIATNQELMEEIDKSRQMKVENKEKLNMTFNHLDEVRELLRGFECLYVKDLTTRSITLPNQYNDDLTRSSKQILQDSLTKSKGYRVTHCICFYSQLGLATINGYETNIVSRTCNVDVLEDSVFKETARLRNLKHDNIAIFVGMLNHERRPVFIFSGDLRPLNIYLLKLSDKEIKTLTSKIMYGIINGLSALHKSEMVHMELSPKTIMIESETEEIKLIGGCLPRTINFPEHNNTAPVGYLTYLSPSVLHGKMYSSGDDIYSLGLIIWQLIFHEDPFHKQSSMGQTEFINTVNPSEMVVLNDEWPPELKALFTGCLFTNPSERLTVSAVRSRLDKCNIMHLVLDRKSPLF